MSEKIWYSRPTQVMYKMRRGLMRNKIHTGIARTHQVYNAENGGISNLSDVVIVRELPWLDLTKAIQGKRVFDSDSDL